MATVATSKGDEMVSGRMIGSTPTQVEPNKIVWGTGSGTATKNDIAAFGEGPEAATTGTSSQVTTTTTNDTYQVVGTITATGGRTITNVALKDNATLVAQNTIAAGGIVGSAVSTTMNTATNYSPGTNNYVQVTHGTTSEVMQVTAGNGTSVLTVVRAQNGTSALSTIAAADIVIAGNIPGQTGVTGGNVFLHADFTGLPLGTNDSIQFTIKTQFN
jgi:hypothetical protein